MQREGTGTGEDIASNMGGSFAVRTSINTGKGGEARQSGASIAHAALMSSKNIKKNQWFLNLHQFSSNENDCMECGASRATFEELRDNAADSLFSIGDVRR
jgi:hypothetical protein